ncbi:hypothetical protein [Campylobacter corcagiensis]|uniref:Uncharacterized protein n=1 Tax=Campylobacter corcagiensis TaxID=1448857 RepID=A0A7M1LGQ6_9BACT|nr:hypothetical protein [Campylobacter corcagiensis]QKF64016.1 putative membrane protein [Campylobacter corcagiensis]QOQ87782.1 hypothetical protein IMC76_02945 [Campylobacter corcagiensis]
MDYTYDMLFKFHSFLSVSLVVLTFVLLFLSQKGEGVAMVKRVRYLYPLYSGVLAGVILTGIIMMPIINFEFSFRIWLMVLTSIVLPALLGAGFSALKRAYYTRHYKTYKDKMKIFIAIILILNLAIWVV